MVRWKKKNAPMHHLADDTYIDGIEATEKRQKW